LRTSLSPQKFKVKVPKYVLDQKDRLQQDLKLSTETIQVQKELIVKYESRENEQRRLLLTMTKERDGLRQQLIERINTDASRASKDSQRQRRELEEARKRAELLSGKVRDMQAALAEADAQLTTYEFQAQQTEVERKESAALLADMTRALQQKHDALTAMSQQCQRAGEDAEARVAELRSRLDASASEKPALQQELADERLQLQQCRDRITELSNLVSVLQTPSSGPHTQSPSLAPSANSTASAGRRSSGGQGDAGQPLKPREAARAVEKVKASPPADSSIAGKISNLIRWT
jgi:chromosome segregation protein